MIWGRNFPREYDTFRRTAESYGPTAYGGSDPYDKLARHRVLRTLWAGYPFSVDYKEERGHAYALADQKATRRVKEFAQPGACADCHDPKTMELRITRPAFKNAMAAAGLDLAKATRQEMRSYVCGQCHVEYYFKEPGKVLTFPCSKGRTVEGIQAVYQANGHADWTHPVTGAKMLKMQHPEFEVWGTGIHARSGVACADCHMPYVRSGAVKASDHWVRSPLVNIRAACGACHPWTEDEMKGRVGEIQGKTAELLRAAEAALVSAVDAVAAAKAGGTAPASTVRRKRPGSWPGRSTWPVRRRSRFAG